MAHDGIEHQRHHHKDTTASNTEEIPALAVQPGPCAHMAPGAFLPNASEVFMQGLSFPHGWTCCCPRCPGQSGSSGQAMAALLPGLCGYKFCKFTLKAQVFSQV